MAQANVTEAELKACGTIPTAFGDDLDWTYLCYVREHPVRWNAPTEILYGSSDSLTPYETMAAFAEENQQEFFLLFLHGQHLLLLFLEQKYFVVGHP